MDLIRKPERFGTRNLLIHHFVGPYSTFGGTTASGPYSPLGKANSGTVWHLEKSEFVGVLGCAMMFAL